MTGDGTVGRTEDDDWMDTTGRTDRGRTRTDEDGTDDGTDGRAEDDDGNGMDTTGRMDDTCIYIAPKF